jgi:DmsE family decaheme c-type cytochrome
VRDRRHDSQSQPGAATSFASQAQEPLHRIAAYAWIILCCCAFAAGAQASTAKAAASLSFVDPTAGAKYVGADTCQGCHSDIYEKSFANTPHAALLKEGKHGCEDCHGPGSLHVDGGGDKTKIIIFGNLSAAQASQRCLRCHQANTENSNFSQSVHLSQGVGCLSCHSPHHAASSPRLLIKAQPMLCYGCHAQQKAEFARPYRHRVDVGLIKCSDCHNPHGTFNDRQLRSSDSGMIVCTKCHSDKMGPFAFEHMPVKQEGCMGCHTPHGSTNPRLLRVSVVNVLCLQCHSPMADRATPEAPSFHNQSAKYQACTMCHTQIHGSNFDEFFFR